MRRRSDANQAEIIEGLRAAGCSVQVLSNVGHGVPDLLVAYGDGMNYLIEVKNVEGRGRRLTEDEIAWQSGWKGPVCTVSSLEEALEAIVWEWNHSRLRAYTLSVQNGVLSIERASGSGVTAS